jgi:hypothetical protein
MKIADLLATTVSVPLEAPLRHANGAHWGRFIRTVVEVICDNGRQNRRPCPQPEALPRLCQEQAQGRGLSTRP